MWEALTFIHLARRQNDELTIDCAAMSRYFSSACRWAPSSVCVVDAGDGGVHAPQPGVALEEAYAERCVTHPEAWVPPLVGVGPWPTPVLLEEHAQAFLGSVEVVLRIDRAKDLILADQLVERRDDGPERVRTTDFVVEQPRVPPSRCPLSPSMGIADTTGAGFPVRAGNRRGPSVVARPDVVIGCSSE